MSFIGYIFLIMFVYYVNSLLRSPAKLLKIFFPKKSSKKSPKNNGKYEYNNPELRRPNRLHKFKLGKIIIKDMIKENFLKDSDIFVHSLENYMLWKFKEFSLIEINEKLYQMLHETDKMSYYKNYSKNLGIKISN